MDQQYFEGPRKNAPTIGVIGVGCVGGALLKAIKQKGFLVTGFDRFKEGFSSEENLAKIIKSDICFLCLPTPTVAGKQKLKALYETLVTLKSQGYKGVVAVKSTILPGTTYHFQTLYPDLKIVHNPEFLTAAKAFEDTMNQPSILIGCEAKRMENAEKLKSFWQMFDGQIPVYVAHPMSTEMAKYMHNLFLATKLSFWNDLSEVCERVGCDYSIALDLALSVGQIGKGHTKIAMDGERGWGGACFPKDTSAFVAWGETFQIPMETLKGAICGNQRRRPSEY